VVRIAIATDGVNNTYFYRDNSEAKFKKVVTYNFKNSVMPMFFDSKNKNVYALSNVGSDKLIAVKMNPKNFKTVEVVYENKNYDTNGLNYSKRFKTLASAEFVDWKHKRKIFIPYYKKIAEGLENYFKNKEVYLTSSNKNEDLFIVYVGSDKTRGMYYTFDVKKDKLNVLANPSPWLNESQMAEMKPIKYKTRDGLTVEGYLTLPKDASKNLPLVVNPHGGPWHRDVWGYNPEVQFLASRGYAVLQMNFRGSTGYGKKFWKASFKEWGKKMQNDITDGVNWTVDQGYVNKENICIYGGSYGGYATLAGLTFTPDLYKCGVDYVGVSNLFTFQATIPEYWKPYKKMLHEMVGHPEKDKALLKSASPYFHADKIKAALFVAQGANDPRVKKSESDQIVQALKARGVEVEYMVKDNEGHGFRNEENRFEFYEKMESFLKENIKQ
jgi:dipeptidyl aminopeptidase/acylaminoacyl peptidase